MLLTIPLWIADTGRRMGERNVRSLSKIATYCCEVCLVNTQTICLSMRSKSRFSADDEDKWKEPRTADVR
ncbi:hypothetical protein TNCV_4695571 [Trichonephila clavipes]|nr:hypothetical protein TNCV_4695571 [Trichonephila clavipes]